MFDVLASAVLVQELSEVGSSGARALRRWRLRGWCCAGAAQAGAVWAAAGGSLCGTALLRVAGGWAVGRAALTWAAAAAVVVSCMALASFVQKSV